MLNAVYGNNGAMTYFNITSPQNSFGSYPINLKFGSLTSWISGNQNYSYLPSNNSTATNPTNNMISFQSNTQSGNLVSSTKSTGTGNKSKFYINVINLLSA